MRTLLIAFAATVTLAAQGAAPQVTPQDLLDGLKDPGKWLTYGGDYSGTRHSPLTQISPENVGQLAAQWTFQTGTLGSFQTTPLVIDGIIYATGFNNHAWAIDARTGRPIWRYRRNLPDDLHVCCGAVNRGFFGTGNPGPDYYSNAREGDNLYTASLVAIDADTGQRRWHYQFTPHDVHDWDSTQVPVLADLTIGGQPRKVVMFANRNGFFYTIDRVTGKVIVAKPFVETTWAKEVGPTGRPILLPGNIPDADGTKTCPDLGGGTNFMSPSYDPTSRLFFVTARETCATYFAFDQKFKPGEQFESGGTTRPRDQKNFGALRAIDPVTATVKWEFRYPSVSASGVLTTGSGLVFAGDGDGNIMAFDSRSGKNLWHYRLGFSMRSTSGTTYLLDGRQYLLVPSGSMLTAFALPERK